MSAVNLKKNRSVARFRADMFGPGSLAVDLGIWLGPKMMAFGAPGHFKF